jgi:hypothetical protein
MTLQIKVDLVPKGEESRSRVIAEAEIFNVVAHEDVSDYRMRAREGRNDMAGADGWQADGGMIYGHQHKSSTWSLEAKDRRLGCCAG